MGLSLLLAKQLIVLLLMAVTGYVSVKSGILKEEDCAPLSALCVYILMPCVIIKALQVDLTSERIRGFLISVVLVILIHLFWFLLTRIFRQLFHISGIEELTLIYSNSGNMIIPLVNTLFGEEYVFYACLYNAVQQLFIWTQGVSVMEGKKKIQWSRIFKNINVLSILAGLVLLFFQIRLPSVIRDTLSGLGSMVGPVSMIVVGMLIAKTDLPVVFRSSRAWLICTGRLLVYPLAVIMVIYISGYLRYFPDDVYLFQIALFAVAAPPAAIISQLAVMYDKDPVYAGICNVISVISCVVTMPFLLILFQMLFS